MLNTHEYNINISIQGKNLPEYSSFHIILCNISEDT